MMKGEEIPSAYGAAAPLVGGWTGCNADGSVFLLSHAHPTNAFIRLLRRLREILWCD